MRTERPPARDGVFARRAARRARRNWRVLAAISVGGAAGSAARYLAARAIGHPPWGTFAVNVAGCLAIGLLMTYVLEVWPPRRYVRPFWGIGVLGGFTTFSTYTVDVRGALARGELPLAAGYAFGSLLAGLAAVWLGVVIARTISRRRVS